MTFGELKIGDRFRFAAEHAWSGLAKGPWVKCSSRTYKHTDNKGNTFRYQIGTIKAKVEKL